MIVIVDYKMGNIGSVLNMLKKIGADAVISSDPREIEKADKLILPGVGAFDTGMKHLHESDLVGVLNEKALDRQTPTLGICLGMQLLTQGSEEGDLSGLGWIDGHTVKFRFDENNRHLKIPHMGWNTVKIRSHDSLFKSLDEDARFYFVHSFHVVCHRDADVLASTHHGDDFVSAVQNRNIMGTQFHPEKSHKFGMKLLRNFAELA
jgi:imidazole glycerol-phosphate synthase subunit HisH